LLPQVPTVDESGVRGYRSFNWNGVLAPAATPSGIVSKLNAEIVRQLRLPEVSERLTGDGWNLVAGTPDEYREFMRDEMKKWARVVKFAGVTPE
jgi:tripartite-type tricarboxylate transporter receptor subunit TctC